MIPESWEAAFRAGVMFAKGCKWLLFCPNKIQTK